MTILDTIVARKKEEIAESRKRISIADLEKAIDLVGAPRGFAQSLLNQALTSPAIIAEIKRGSPSLGCIRPDMDCVSQAKSYRDGGAVCLSVLTDHDFFFAKPGDFSAVRAAVPMPMLRKDFMIDEYQVLESRAMGADCILLIMACLEDKQAASLAERAHAFGLDVLCEVHNEEEISRALDHVNFDLIGINNRNLKTFKTSWELTLDLASRVPDRSRLVAESGLHSPDAIRSLWNAEIKAFLIGEALVKAPDAKVKLQELMLL